MCVFTKSWFFFTRINLHLCLLFYDSQYDSQHICARICVVYSLRLHFFFFLFYLRHDSAGSRKNWKKIKTNRTVFHPWLIFFFLYLLRSFTLFPTLTLSLSLSLSLYLRVQTLDLSHGSRRSSSIFSLNLMYHVTVVSK